MIVFDNIDIEQVAKVYIDDIKVSGIRYEQVTRNRPISAGSVFVRNRAGTRTVTVTFAILKQGRNERQAALDAIRAWAKSDKEYKLEIQGHPDHYLIAVCTEKPSPSLRQWWEGKLKLVFTCYSNPYWNDKAEKSVACGTQFHVIGDAEPLMYIVANGTSYSLDGRTMSFSSVPSGSIIDLNNQTAKNGDESIMQYYNVNSQWLIPRTGTQTISGTGTVKYRERFE